MPIKKSTEELFWMKVDLQGPVPEHDETLGPCWIWTAGSSTTCYGTKYGYFHISTEMARLTGRPRTIAAHRYAWELLIGPPPENLQLDHLCRVTLCCNPFHLEPVTQKENLYRGLMMRRRIASCPQGHLYDQAGPGYRKCQSCQEERRLLLGNLIPGRSLLPYRQFYSLVIP